MLLGPSYPDTCQCRRCVEYRAYGVTQEMARVQQLYAGRGVDVALPVVPAWIAGWYASAEELEP